MAYPDCLVVDLRRYLNRIQLDNWQFVFEPYDGYAPSDIRSWPEISRLLSHPGQWEAVMQYLDAALAEEKWSEVLAAALLIDRRTYRNKREESVSLQDKAEQAAKEGAASVPLQLQIRRIRLLRNQGLLVESNHKIDELMMRMREGKIPAREEELKAAKTRCLNIKARINDRLGRWKLAAKEAVQAIQISSSSRPQDHKSTATSFHVLTRIIQSSSPDSFAQIRYMLNLDDKPQYLQAYEFNRHAATLVSFDAFHFSRHQHHAGNALLLHCLARQNPLAVHEVIEYLETAIQELKLCLRAQSFLSVHDHGDQKHVLAYCLHSLGIAIKEKASRGFGNEDLSIRVNKLSKTIYLLYQKGESIHEHIGEINAVLADLGLDSVREEELYNEQYVKQYITDWDSRGDLRYPRLNGDLSPARGRIPVLLQNLGQAVPVRQRIDSDEARHHTDPIPITTDIVNCTKGEGSLSGSLPATPPNERAANLSTTPLEELDPNLAPVGERHNKSSLLRSDRPRSVSGGSPVVRTVYEPVVSASMGIIPGSDEENFVRELKREQLGPGERHSVTARDVHDALVYQYRPATNDWIYWRTLAYVGKEVVVDQKGGQRELVAIKFLNQPDHKAWHVAKYYPKQKRIKRYLQDVVKQKLARYLVMQFNNELAEGQTPYPQIDMIPAAHLQILDEHGENVEDYFTTEQFISSKFRKITDAYGRVSSDSPNSDILTALTHYTWRRFGWSLLIDDNQGWEQEYQQESKRIILTDPGMATVDQTLADNCGTSVEAGWMGFKHFWTGKPESRGCVSKCEGHRGKCNKYCKSLKLVEPPRETLNQIEELDD